MSGINFGMYLNVCTIRISLKAGIDRDTAGIVAADFQILARKQEVARQGGLPFPFLPIQ